MNLHTHARTHTHSLSHSPYILYLYYYLFIYVFFTQQLRETAASQWPEHGSGQSPPRVAFDPRAFHVESFALKWQWAGCPWVRLFPPVSIIPPMLHSHSSIYRRRCIFLATEAVVKQGTGKALRHNVLTNDTVGIRQTVASCPQWPPSLSCYTARTWNRLLSNATVNCITVLLQIREVPCSKLDQGTGCQKRTLSCLPTGSLAKCRGPCRVILSESLNESHVNKVIIMFSKGQRRHDVWPP